MNAPIVENASGDCPAGAPPVIRFSPGSHARFDSNDFADPLFFFDEFKGFENAAIPMAIVIGGKDEFPLFGFPNHCITLRSGDGEWLFGENMLSGAEAIERERGVGVVGSDDGD